MEDPTNHFSASVAAADPARSAEAPKQPAPKQPRTFAAPSWLAAAAKFPNWQPLQRIAAGANSPLLWGLDGLSANGRERLTLLHRQAGSPRWNKVLKAELSAFLDSSLTPDAALDQVAHSLAWAYLLPLAAKQSPATAGLLVERLLDAVDLALPSNATGDALIQLLLKVELPLLLANVAPDSKTATSLRKGAIGAESRISNAYLDPLGLPTQTLSAIRPWLATLMRGHELARTTDSPFSDTAKDRLERLARHALRLSRPDGGSVLQNGKGSASDREFLTAVVMSTTSAGPIAALALGKGAVEKKPIKGMQPAPLYSVKSSLAVLRTNWAAPQVQATFDFTGSQPWLDVSAGNQSLLHGVWESSIRVNDAELAPLGPWTEVCWHSDADCDYIEIEQKLSGGWLLQRHLMLVRRDECVLLADSLLDETKRTPEEFMATAAEAPRLEYCARLPIAPEISFAPQLQSREGHLQQGRKPLALVLPIALPEWRKQPAAGELTAANGKLEHRLRAQARNLFAPVWLDLNPKRFKKAQCTWRQLTIGEHLHVQPREVAVGYRVQIHYSQWLLYRSLAWRGNRTVLGKNYATDFACCRFQPNGETQDILEVQ